MLSHSVLPLSLEFIREAIKGTIFHSWTEYLTDIRAVSIDSRILDDCSKLISNGPTLSLIFILNFSLIIFLQILFLWMQKARRVRSLEAIKNFLKFHAQVMTSRVFIFSILMSFIKNLHFGRHSECLLWNNLNKKVCHFCHQLVSKCVVHVLQSL